METRVSRLLGTKYPVIQGGMAWVAESHLAAAVSNAGGLGIIGAASAPPEVVREQIREVKARTDRPFGVNVMLLNPNGTRFVVSKESIVHENYKERIVKARDIDSEVTGMSTGHPIRVLRNAMSREYLKLEKEGAGFEELEQLTLGSLRKAVMDGDVVHGSLMAGQCAGLVKKEQTCQEMIKELMAQTAGLLGDGDFWEKKSVFLGRTSDKGE